MFSIKQTLENKLKYLPGVKKARGIGFIVSINLGIKLKIWESITWMPHGFDWLKAPLDRLVQMRLVINFGGCPAEGWHILIGWSTDGHHLQVGGQLGRGHLGVNGAMRAKLEIINWISASLVVQITACGNGVLARVRWTAVAARQRVLVHIIVAHQMVQ